MNTNRIKYLQDELIEVIHEEIDENYKSHILKVKVEQKIKKCFTALLDSFEEKVEHDLVTFIREFKESIKKQKTHIMKLLLLVTISFFSCTSPTTKVRYKIEVTDTQTIMIDSHQYIAALVWGTPVMVSKHNCTGCKNLKAQVEDYIYSIYDSTFLKHYY